MTDFARLVMVSDTTGLRDARDELGKLAKEGAQTEKSVNKSTDGMARAYVDANGRIRDSITGRFVPAVDRAKYAIDGIGDQATRTNREVSLAARKMGAAYRNVAMAAAKMAGSLVGAFLSGRFFTNAIQETENLERAMLRVQAVIRATGGVAGRSAEQLLKQANALADATLADEVPILEAMQRLLTFRNIRGEVFDDAISAALDLSEAMGIDLQSATLQVAKALELPSQGLTALTRSGTVFTQQQKDQVRAMEAVGDIAGAQRLILEELEKQYGGTAVAAAQGLSGAYDTLGKSFREMSRSLVDNFGLMDATEAAVRAMSEAAGFLSDNMGLIRGITIAAAGVVVGMYTPAIIGATIATGAWIASLITLRGALLATGVGGLIVGAGMLIDYLLRLRSATGSWGEALSALGDLASGVWEGIKTSASALVPALGAVWADIATGFYTMLEGISGAFSEFMGMFTSLSGLPSIGPTAPFKALGDAAVSVTNAVDGFSASANRASLEADQLRFMADTLAQSGFDKARAAAQDLAAIFSKNTDETTEAADAARVLAQELDAVAGGAGGGAPAVERAMEKLTEAQKRAAEAAQRVEQGFESAFVGFVTGAQSARQAASQLLSQLAQLAAQSAFRGMFGGSFGGSFLSGIFGGARAMGGPVTGGTTYLVGERGPELFTPQGSGQIIPNNALGGAGPSGQLVIKLDPSLRAEMRGEMQGIAIEYTSAGLQKYSRDALPQRVQQVSTDPRRRG